MFTRQEIIEYLKSQEKELRANDLISVYRHTYTDNAPYLTKFFLDCGFDPLKYLRIVPPQYAYDLHEHYNTEITLPNHIEAVDLWAFANTRATSLYIPSSVYYIRDAAFTNANLRKIYIAGCPIVHKDAFFDCAYVTDIKIDCSKEEWFKRNPDTVTTKEDWPYAFSDCIHANLQFLK